MCVPSVYQDVWKKTAKIYVWRLLFHIFSGLKKTEMSYWNPQWQVIGHWCNTWNETSWNGVGTLHFPGNSMRKFAGPDLDIWGLLLWYENATPHKIHQTYELLQPFHWELLVSSTLYTVLDLLDQTVICLGSEVVLGWSPIPQLWGSGNGYLWIAASNTAWLLWQQNFKLIPRWEKCINVHRDYEEKLTILLRNKWITFNIATTIHLISTTLGTLLI